MAESQQVTDSEAASVAAAEEVSEFDALLNKQFKPKTDSAREAVQTAVKTLAEQALARTALISKDALSSIEAIIAELDRKLSEQISLIVHHEDFKSLEGTWRGQIHFYPGAGPTEMVLRFQWDGYKWKGHLNINYSVKDFAPESLDLTDLQVGAREFTFSDPSSAGANKLKITFCGVNSGVELRGTSEAKLVGKVNGGDYKLEMLGDWTLRREQ